MILLDGSMPAMSGLEAAHRFRQEVPGVKILVISQNDPVQLLPAVLEAEAHGCVDKSRLIEDLLPMINDLRKNSPCSMSKTPN